MMSFLRILCLFVCLSGLASAQTSRNAVSEPVPVDRIVAVVNKDVPAYALMVGVPARQVGWMSEYGHKLKFDQDGIAICPESKEKYKLLNGRVSKIND